MPAVACRGQGARAMGAVNRSQGQPLLPLQAMSTPHLGQEQRCGSSTLGDVTKEPSHKVGRWQGLWGIHGVQQGHRLSFTLTLSNTHSVPVGYTSSLNTREGRQTQGRCRQTLQIHGPADAQGKPDTTNPIRTAHIGLCKGGDVWTRPCRQRPHRPP